MDRDHQITFVNQTCMKLALDIATMIDEEQTPEQWDQDELRVFIADKAEAQAKSTLIRRSPDCVLAQAYRHMSKGL